MSREHAPPPTLNKSGAVLSKSNSNITTITPGLNAVALVDKRTQKQREISYVMKWVELEPPPEITHSYDPTFCNPAAINNLFSLEPLLFSFDGLKDRIDRCEQIDFDSAIHPDNKARILNQYLWCFYYLVTEHINSFSIQDGIRYRLLYSKRLADYFSLITQIYPRKVENHIRSQNKNNFIAVAESVAAELYRLIISPDFTPKVRAITTKNDQGETVVVGSISKTIPHFQHFQRTQKVIQLLETSANEHSQHWVRMIVACFVLAEFDLNSKNVGFNADELVKIDHELSFFPLLRNTIFSTELPNTIYDSKTALSHFTTFDIAHFPFLHDVKPASSINTLTYYITKIEACLNTVAKKDDTKDYAYYLLTKSLLLLTESTIATVINDFSTSNHRDLEEELKKFISCRMQKLKTVLFMTPEYRDFLLTRMHEWYEKLKTEIDYYNRITCGGEISKTHKQHRKIEFSSVAQLLQLLQTECERKQQEIQRDPYVELIFRFKELMNRYSRETTAIKNIKRRADYEINAHEKAKLGVVYNTFLASLNKTMERDIQLLFTLYGSNTLENILKNIDCPLGYSDSKIIISIFTRYCKKEGLSCLLAWEPLRVNANLMEEFFQSSIYYEPKTDIYTQLMSDTALQRYLPTYLIALCINNCYSDIPTVIHFIFCHFNDAVFKKARMTIFHHLNSVEDPIKKEFQSFSEKNPDAFLSALFHAIQGLHVDPNSLNANALFAQRNPHPSNGKNILDRCAIMLNGKKSIFNVSEFNYLKALHEGRIAAPDALRNALHFLFPNGMPGLSNQAGIIEMSIDIEKDENATCKLRVNCQETVVAAPSLNSVNE